MSSESSLPLHISPALVVNLLLCTILHIPYVYLLAPPGEVATPLVVAEIVSELGSHGELGHSCRVSIGG